MKSRFIIVAPIIIALSLVFFGLMFFLMPLPQEHHRDLHMFMDMLPDFLGILALVAYLWFANSWIEKKVIYRLLDWHEKPGKSLVIVMITATVFTIIFTWVTTKFYLYYHMKNFHHDIQDQELFGLKAAIVFAVMITLFIKAFYTGNFFFEQWKASYQQAQELKAKNIQSQFDALKNQVNPHFLFNSLNILTALIDENQEQAKKFVRQLSEVYRFVLASKDKNLIELSKELEFIKSYIYLHQIRFSGGIVSEINIDEKYLSYKIPPLSLQMLIENSFKHNILTEEKPLILKIFTSNDETLVVENNVMPKFNNQPSTGIGLTNIQERYLVLSDRQVKIEKSDESFKVILPLINE